MRRHGRFLSAATALGLALLLGACADEGDSPATGSTADAPATGDAPAGTETAAADPEPQPQPQREQRNVDPDSVPVIFMALQDGGAASHSVVFALDSDRDGSAIGERAIRLTPEDGQCNPQELTRYDFGGSDPVFGVEQANAGIRPAEIPRYLAFVASQALVDSGLAPSVEATAPQNICTRKWWELWLTQARTREEAPQPAG